MTEHDDSPRIRRLCISVDVERYSRWQLDDQGAAQDGLDAVLEETCRAAGLERWAWSQQDSGDGQLAVLPPGIDEDRVISGFVSELQSSLYRHNRRLNAEARLRVRVAMHVGMTKVAGLGFAGNAPIVVARLRDSQPVRRMMAEHPAADFVLVISDVLYDDHIGNEHPHFNVGAFSRVRVEDPAKAFAADAWLYVPPGTGSSKPSPASAPAPTTHRPGPADNRSGGVYVSENARVESKYIAGRDLGRHTEDEP